MRNVRHDGGMRISTLRMDYSHTHTKKRSHVSQSSQENDTISMATLRNTITHHLRPRKSLHGRVVENYVRRTRDAPNILTSLPSPSQRSRRTSRTTNHGKAQEATHRRKGKLGRITSSNDRSHSRHTRRNRAKPVLNFVR